MRRLILGGARSGKSHFAETLLGAFAGEPGVVEYVATSAGRPDDAEWAARVALHRARRPSAWTTTETLDVTSVLGRPGPSVLVDCLTVWLSRVMDECGCWVDERGQGGAPGASEVLKSRVDALVTATSGTGRDVVFVSNEVGQGIVPATASGRLFRDEMGILNLKMAAACDEVWFVTAGIPQQIKGCA